MLVLIQIGIGGALLLACAMVHILIIAKMIRHLKDDDHFGPDKSRTHQIMTVCFLFLGAIISHTLQIYISALSLWLIGALPGYEEPIYFALATYQTLGYGDVVLTEQFRILGAMISVTGILMFGMTTAFLVGIFARVLDDDAR
ncbi:two pore domain potassium channel family protein [Roseobacter ponti]|uniref:Two pore domain potassium channel family protein n=1 Tax=Roseobacter ponti TaxID=1891787 RepID=A0A858SSQ1_9RHOB|nr:two pore domain potassium channel family protein [Roseobacter ponti]QJF49926.1 two pore domain potassium channel family protein [Roseobacter ponti]